MRIIKKTNIKLFIIHAACIFLTSYSVHSQSSYGIISVDSNTTAVNNSPNDSAFFARVAADLGNLGGNSDSLKRTIVSCEAETLKLTNAIISQFAGSSGASYKQYGGALISGEYVNVYMVYLNDTADWMWCYTRR